MFTTLSAVSVFLVLIRSTLTEANLLVNVSNCIQCGVANTSWTNTSRPPYLLTFLSMGLDKKGDGLLGTAIVNYTSITWPVYLVEGTVIECTVVDAIGNQGQINVTVGPSNDSSCLEGNSSLTSTSTSSSPSASASAVSGSLSTRPLGIATVLGSAVLAVAAFAL